MHPVIHTFVAAAQRLFKPLGSGDGLGEEALGEAEARLRLALPRALREVYRVSGRRMDLHASRNRLLAPDELALEGEVLVFYEDPERQTLWGMRRAELGQEDPPVLSCSNAAPLRWGPEADRLTSFLEGMLLEQRLSVAPWVMKRKVGRGLLGQLEALYPRLDVRGRVGESARWYGRDGHLLRAQGTPPNAVVTVAAPSGEALMTLAERLEISWSDADWAG
jgi:hypothetical protein